MLSSTRTCWSNVAMARKIIGVAKSSFSRQLSTDNDRGSHTRRLGSTLEYQNQMRRTDYKLRRIWDRVWFRKKTMEIINELLIKCKNWFLKRIFYTVRTWLFVRKSHVKQTNYYTWKWYIWLIWARADGYCDRKGFNPAKRNPPRYSPSVEETTPSKTSSLYSLGENPPLSLGFNERRNVAANLSAAQNSDVYILERNHTVTWSKDTWDYYVIAKISIIWSSRRLAS